jgi:hypothetical protein
MSTRGTSTKEVRSRDSKAAVAEDPNRVTGMPILRHSLSGKSTGAISNWFDCKNKWGPYLESKYGDAGRVVKDGAFPIPSKVDEPTIPDNASEIGRRAIIEEHSFNVKSRLKKIEKMHEH